jgi:syntaxin-binding protein 1
MPKIITLNY